MDFDFFDLTGLSFDPCEKNPNKTKNSIQKAIDNEKAKLGTVTQTGERDSINKKLAFLQRVLNDVANKNIAEIENLAADRKEATIKRLEATVKIEALGKTERIVTSGKIKSQRLRTKLSKESVEEVYTRNGFQIIEINPLAAMPKWPTNAEKTYEDLIRLRNMTDPNPNGLDRSHIVDLYSFAAYIQGDPETTHEYLGMSTKDLANLFGAYAMKNSMRNDDLGKLCASIATAAKTYVFNSEANRKSYDLFVLFKGKELTELFDAMHAATPTDLLNPIYAEHCISIISSVFGNTDIALAIYNDQAGLRDDPYIPEKASFSVKCQYCMNISEFTSFNEAVKSNHCKHCGKELYKTCPNPDCKKPVLASATRCPECGFVFANLGLFTKYYSQAEEALRQARLSDARDMLIRAKAANPKATDSISALDKKITEEERKLSEPLNKLKILISQKKYEEASRFLGTVVARFPNVNLTDQKKETDSVLNSCMQKYASIQGQSKTIAVNTCVAILTQCADYRAAINFLRTNPPEACQKVSAMPNDIDQSIVVNWQPSREYGVTYCLIRKEGKYLSSGLTDGVLLYQGSETSFIDKNVTPGTIYCYTLLYQRMESISQPNGVLSCLLLGIKNVRYEQSAKGLSLFWHLPRNCYDASVDFVVQGKKYRLAEHAHESVVLESVSYGIPYEFSITANYGSLGQSGVTKITIVPTPIIQSFQIYYTQKGESKYSIKWDIKERGVDLQIIVNGKVAQTTRSENLSCEISLPLNSFATVSVKAFSGGGWISSNNELVINTYQGVPITSVSSTPHFATTSKGTTSSTEFSIKLGSIPSNAIGFYCFIKTKAPGMTNAPWATEQDVRRGGEMVSIEEYNEFKEIIREVPTEDEESYYITLITAFKINEKIILSSPFKKPYRRPLNANLFWRVTKPVWGPAKIELEYEANYPINIVPSVVLCASSQGSNLLSPDDPYAVIIWKKAESVYAERRTVWIEESEFKLPNTVRKKDKLYLFLVDSALNESVAIRWAAGFEGKL